MSNFKSLKDLTSTYSGGSVAFNGQLIITANESNISLTPTSISSSGGGGVDQRQLEGATDSDLITAMASTGNILCSASRSLQISVHDLKTGELLHRFKSYHQAPIVSICIHSSTHLLVTGSSDSTVRVYDLRTKSCTHTFRTSSLVSGVQFFDRAGNWLVCAGCEDGRLYVWDLMDRQVKLSIGGHSSVLRSIAFSGWLMITGSRDSTVCFWDMRKIIAGGASDDCKLETFAVFEAVEYCGFIEPHPHSHSSSASDDLIPNNVDDVITFYTAGDKGQLRLWRRSGAQITATTTFPHPSELTNQIHPIVHAIYDRPSNQFMLVDSHQNISIVRLSFPNSSDSSVSDLGADLESDQEYKLALVETRVGTFDEINDLKFIGPNGRWLLMASTNEKVTLVDLGLQSSSNLAGAPNGWGNVSLLPGHSEAILCVDGDCYDPSAPVSDDTGDVSVYLFVTGSKDNSVKLWSLTFNASNSSVVINHLADFMGHVEEVTSIRLSRRSPAVSSYKTIEEALHDRFILTASNDRTVKKWNLNDLNYDNSSGSGEVCKGVSEWTVKAHDKDLNSIDCSYSNKYFVTSSHDRTAKIWSLATGEPVGLLKGHKRGVWSVRYAPGDRYIVTCSGDKTIKLWNPLDFSCVRTFESHTNSVLRVEFVESTFIGDQGRNQMMVSSGSDGLTKIWHIPSSDCIQTLDNHEDKVWALAIRDPKSYFSTQKAKVEDVLAEDGDLTLTSKSISHKCLIVTGAGDSKVSVSLDVTEESLRKLQLEQEEKILQDQELSNFMHKKDFAGAFEMALHLKRSLQLADILKQSLLAHHSNESSSSGKNNSVVFMNEIDSLVMSLDGSRLEMFLSFLKDWNTQAKWTQVSQGALYLILKSRPPKDLMQLNGIKVVLDALIPYTDRHLHRVDELQIANRISDFALSEMKVIQSTPSDTSADLVGR